LSQTVPNGNTTTTNHHYHHHHHPRTAVHGVRTTTDVDGPAGARGRPVVRGRGAMSGGRGLRVARARCLGAPRVHAGGHRSVLAAAVVGRLGPRGTRSAAAQEQAGRDVRTVSLPSW